MKALQQGNRQSSRFMKRHSARKKRAGRWPLALAVCGALACVPGGVALAGQHYASGVEGMKIASLPPPGTYWKTYFTYYQADSLRNNSGNEVGDLDVSKFILLNRLIWTSGTQILGADPVLDIVVPLIYTDYKFRMGEMFGDNRWGLGDVYLEALLSWHLERVDLVAGVGLWTPVGSFDADRPASPGGGFWTPQLTVGGTVFFDDARTWHLSAAARYEIHTEQDDTDVRYGNELSFEWGLGKDITKSTTFGLAGYCLWQLTDDSGPGTSDDHRQAFAVGPEITTVIPGWNLLVSLRSEWEFGVHNRPQGNMTTLSLTYTF